MRKILLILILVNTFVLAIDPGDYVCNYYDRAKDSKWCGTVVQTAGDKLKIDVTKVNCTSGGFLGICIQFNEGTCTGHIVLKNNQNYSIWVPRYCVE